MPERIGSSQTEFRSTVKPGTGSVMAESKRPLVKSPLVSACIEQEDTEELHRAASRTQALLNTISDLTFVVKKGGVITEFHAPKDNEYFLTAEAVIGRRLMDLLPPSIGQQAMYYLEKTLRTGNPQSFTCPYEVLGRGREFRVRVARSNPEEIIAVVRDVTDHKRLEKEILEISNREQMRIGQDLHDGLGQHLTGITFLTRALENDLAAKALPEAAAAAEIGHLVLQALTQTRSLARGLFPVEVEAHGLGPALTELAANIENIFGIDCRFEGDEHLSIRNPAVASNLFRLAQEAVNNSVKHGKAKQILIGLTEEGERTILSIRDNGAGLPKETVKSKGLGLRIMSYRAQRIGGTFDIQPGEQGGTVVTCSFSNTPAEANTLPGNSAAQPNHN